jgi:hypothetical protein
MKGDKSTNLELLEAIATQPFESCEAQWRKLLRKLKLELCYVLPIQKILKQEGWKKHPNPLGYIKTAAIRTAVRMGLVDAQPAEGMEVLAADLKYTDWEGRELGHDEKLDFALYEYEQKSGGSGWDDTPSDLVRRELWDEEQGEIAWERVEELAELDEGEQMVLELRAVGFTRNMALDACYTSDDRRFLQSAWRRLERDKDLIKKVLKSGQPCHKKPVKNVAEDVELVMLQGEDGKVKISFRINVPENGKRRI